MVPLVFHARAALLAALALMWPVAARSATINATVTDDKGRPVLDAVVMITPEPGTPAPRPMDSRLATAWIDQTDEAFVPSVVVIRPGGTVVIRNNDSIRHHVYSFSPLNRFEFVQLPGATSQPIVFPQAGAVAIGCNIHDQMAAHVLVTTAPWGVVTNAEGKAVIDAVPAGRFVATVWHPRLRPGVDPPTLKLELATDQSTLSVTIPVLPPRRIRARDY
jgi:plastocyanin